jgi:hypothetical protein
MKAFAVAVYQVSRGRQRNDRQEWQGTIRSSIGVICGSLLQFIKRRNVRPSSDHQECRGAISSSIGVICVRLLR